MAVLIWRGTTAGVTGSNDWNTGVNWLTPVIVNGTGGVPTTTKLQYAGRSPWANDDVYIYNVLPYPIVGSSVSNTPILANCSTGGMAVTGLTYYWTSTGVTQGITSTGPLNSLTVAVSGKPAAGYAYQKFSWNEENSIPLFWKNGTQYLINDYSWMTDLSQYWTTNFYGVLNGGFTAGIHNTVSSVIKYSGAGITAEAPGIPSFSMNRFNVGLSGKIGKWSMPEFLETYQDQASGYGYWFGDINVSANTTVNSMHIRGQPNSVYMPLGTTCEVLQIQPLNHYSLVTTVAAYANIGVTTNRYSSASSNDYNAFKGIRFNKSYPYTVGGLSYSVFIGNPIGSTLSGSGAAPVYYNIWEDNVSNIVGGEAQISVQGSCFINDMLLEDSSMSISTNSNSEDSMVIKGGELRGFSSIDLRKWLPSSGYTVGVPMILGAVARAAGNTGAAGLTLSSRDATFIPHPNTTISF